MIIDQDDFSEYIRKDYVFAGNGKILVILKIVKAFKTYIVFDEYLFHERAGGKLMNVYLNKKYTKKEWKDRSHLLGIIRDKYKNDVEKIKKFLTVKGWVTIPKKKESEWITFIFEQ